MNKFGESKFSARVRRYLELHPDNRQRLAKEFGASLPTIDRWASGRNAPHPMMIPIVEEFLNKHI
jgi:transcriptional regulator with XRE-family HTH domain